MNLIMLMLFVVLVMFMILGVRYRRNRPYAPKISARKAHKLLLKNVRFYKRLNREEQLQFMNRAKDFLDKVRITAVGTLRLKTLDRIYVASAAIIPIFRYADWSYNNLNEVLVYPGNFSKDFQNKGPDVNVMGMVGDGAMNRTMILSIGALRTGFEQAGSGNTGIHEFVHLVDKADGAVDGIPEFMLPPELSAAWLDYVRQCIEEIRKGNMDINPYGASNEAEFLAVVSEYFFQRPEDMKEKYPELWGLLERIYTPELKAEDKEL